MIIFSKHRQNFSILKRTTRITGDRAINYPQFGEVDLYIRCAASPTYIHLTCCLCAIYISNHVLCIHKGKSCTCVNTTETSITVIIFHLRISF